jgi:general secretion pathway protein I
MNFLKKQSGFSLLEIMVAVAIMATGFVALLGLQNSTMVATQRAERLTTATFLARQKMVEYEIELEKDMEKNKFPRDEKEETGSFDDPYEDYRWKWTIKKVEIPVINSGKGEGQDVLIASYMKNISDQISRSVRELQLTIYWGDKDIPIDEQQNLVLTTHIVDLR